MPRNPWALDAALLACCCLPAAASSSSPDAAAAAYPLVMHTWPWTGAAAAAWEQLTTGGSRLDALEKGCNYCELSGQCGSPPSVGAGGHEDASGEVTLDAMMFDGPTHDVGAVGGLRRVKRAISAARGVLEHTNHSLLVGDAATAFAVDFLGLEEESLGSADADKAHAAWVENGCQPNYYRDIEELACPPYGDAEERGSARGRPRATRRLGVRSPSPSSSSNGRLRYSTQVHEGNHDTIGMVVIDAEGQLACGTSTNGLANKVPGRVGDTPLAGAGCYVDNDVGGAAATGDGDVMLRFSPTARAVDYMAGGLSPHAACEKALRNIVKYYEHFTGGLICVNKKGEFGAAGWNWVLSYSVRAPGMDGVETHDVPPMKPLPEAVVASA